MATQNFEHIQKASSLFFHFALRKAAHFVFKLKTYEKDREVFMTRISHDRDCHSFIYLFTKINYKVSSPIADLLQQIVALLLISAEFKLNIINFWRSNFEQS